MRSRALLLAGSLLFAPIGCERAVEPPALPTALPPALPPGVDRVDPAVASLLRTRRQAVVAAPTDAARWRDLALALEANELFPEALACVSEAVRRDPEAARAWYQLGRLAVRSGDLERGRDAFETVIRLAPGYGPAAWQMGWIDLERGEFRQAEETFQWAVAVDPTAAAAWTGLARAWLGLDRAAEAAELLERLVEEDATARSHALHLLASAQRRLGRAVRATPAAAPPRWPDPWTTELAKHRPGYGARIEGARRDLDAGRREAARTTLRALRDESPDNPVVAATLARAEREAGRPDAALIILDEVLAARPGFFPAHFERAVTLAQQSAAASADSAPALRARADAAAVRVLELNPSYAPAHALRGDLATIAGNLDAAAGHYTEAQRCDRTDARWPQRCGLAALRQGDWAGAQRWLERALAMTPTDVDGQLGLAVALLNQGRLDAADAALARAVALRPDDPRLTPIREQLRLLRAGAAP